MAFSSRLRSGILLFQRILSASDRSLGNPSVAKFEGLRNFLSQVKATDANVKLQKHILNKVESEILDVVAASKKTPLFSQFIKDLPLPRETRVMAISEIFGEAGFSDVTKNFLAVLADNGRLRNIEWIAKRFVELTMALKGEVKVNVTTVIARPSLTYVLEMEMFTV